MRRYIYEIEEPRVFLSVRVRTHKDYGHGRSKLPLCDMSADVDEGTGISSV
jgi:hypothetical protein